MFKNEELAYKNGECATVSIGNWIVLDLIRLLNIIPVLGTIAALVLYIIIAANKEGTPSIQNRIIVDFIWLGVQLLALLVLFALLYAGTVSLSGAIDVLNGTLYSTRVS